MSFYIDDSIPLQIYVRRFNFYHKMEQIYVRWHLLFKHWLYIEIVLHLFNSKQIIGLLYSFLFFNCCNNWTLLYTNYSSNLFVLFSINSIENCEEMKEKNEDKTNLWEQIQWKITKKLKSNSYYKYVIRFFCNVQLHTNKTGNEQDNKHIEVLIHQSF